MWGLILSHGSPPQPRDASHIASASTPNITVLLFKVTVFTGVSFIRGGVREVSRNGKKVARVRVGKYTIPDTRIHPKLYEATKSLYEEFKSEDAPSQLTAAQLLDHKSVSGAFLRKIAALRAYGLIEKRGIRVTELGKKLTYDPSEQERNEALKQAILNIPLWKEFYGKWGVNLPTSNFWVQLGKITGLEAPDAKKLENIVKKAYLDDIRYLKPEKKPEEEDIDVVPEDTIDTETTIPIGLEEFRFGDIRIWLPKEKTQEAWKKTKKMLDIYLGIEEEG